MNLSYMVQIGMNHIIASVLAERLKAYEAKMKSDLVEEAKKGKRNARPS